MPTKPIHAFSQEVHASIYTPPKEYTDLITGKQLPSSSISKNSVVQKMRGFLGIPSTDPLEVARVRAQTAALSIGAKINRVRLKENFSRSTVTLANESGSPSMTITARELLKAPGGDAEAAIDRLLLDGYLPKKVFEKLDPSYLIGNSHASVEQALLKKATALRGGMSSPQKTFLLYSDGAQLKPHVDRQVFETEVMGSKVTVQIKDFGKVFPKENLTVEALLGIMDLEAKRGLKTLADVDRIDPKAPWLTIKMGDAFDVSDIWLAIKSKERDIRTAQRNAGQAPSPSYDPNDPELLNSEIKVRVKDHGEVREDTMTVAQALKMLKVENYNQLRDGFDYHQPWKTVTVGEAFDLKQVRSVIEKAKDQVRVRLYGPAASFSTP